MSGRAQQCRTPFQCDNNAQAPSKEIAPSASLVPSEEKCLLAVRCLPQNCSYCRQRQSHTELEGHREREREFAVPTQHRMHHRDTQLCQLNAASYRVAETIERLLAVPHGIEGTIGRESFHVAQTENFDQAQRRRRRGYVYERTLNQLNKTFHMRARVKSTH